MDILHTFGHWNISSEKIDDCPWKYIDIIDTWAAVIVIISFVGMFISAQYQNILCCIGFAGICASIIIMGCFLSYSWYSCGIIIKLFDDNYEDFCWKSTSYQFTDNPDYDALEIKTIIDKFESYANKIDAENTKREEEKLKSQKECCNKYKSVIQKVKND